MNFFFKILLWVVVVLIFITLIPYIISPVYDFHEPAAFKGNKLFNPYSDIQNNKWYKANFHSHSNLYWGLTDGRLSNPDDLHKTYSNMGYDIIGISNYMNLDVTDTNENGFFPVYEHGFGIWKNHYLVIGADNVKLLDFVYYPTTNNKQFIINSLKKDNNLISIVHPWMRNAVSLDDVSYLDNYDCIEICRYSRTSVEYVDKALSSGKNIKIIANDDSHDITNQDEVGKSLTIINSKSKNYGDVISAIKQGSAVSVNLINSGFNTFEAKNKRIPLLPNLTKFNLVGDTISLMFDSLAVDIKFIGQNGVVKSSVSNTDKAAYYFKNDDSYIRVEATFPNNAVYYLNPVFRYDSEINKTYKSKINYPLTIAYYVLWIAGFVFIVVILRRQKFFGK